jgi:hypothetical protein
VFKRIHGDDGVGKLIRLLVAIPARPHAAVLLDT